METEQESSYEYKIEMGAMMGCPLYDTHSLSKNWLALIRLDPRSPGGIKREFCEKAKGEEYYYLTSGLYEGAAVEFGVNYYTGSGRKRPARWYGIVKEMKEDLIIFEEFEDARSAINAGTNRDEALKKKDDEIREFLYTIYSKDETQELISSLSERGLKIVRK